jgi:hypothetical protein
MFYEWRRYRAKDFVRFAAFFTSFYGRELIMMLSDQGSKVILRKV